MNFDKQLRLIRSAIPSSWSPPQVLRATKVVEWPSQLEILLNTLNIPEEKHQKLERDLAYSKFPSESEWITDEKGEVVASSFSQLILYIINSNLCEARFRVQFLVVCSAFTTDEEVLASLIIMFYNDYWSKEYAVKSQRDIVQVRSQVGSIISTWLKCDIFNFSGPFLTALEIFIDFLIASENYKEIGNSILKSYEQYRCLKSSLMLCQRGPSPSPTIPTLPESSWTMYNVAPLELARQITIFQAKIFNEITSSELFKIVENNKPEISTNVEKLTDHFNRFSNLISNLIIKQPKKKDRVKILLFWLDVASELFKIKNYHGTFMIMCAITHPAVVRMKRTFEGALVKKDAISKFKKLKKLCSFDDNFNVYRKEIKFAGPPCIPFMGCFQKDLVYLNEHSSNHYPNLINIQRYFGCFTTIYQIEKFQNIKYSFIEVPKIIKMFALMPTPDSTAHMMKASVEMESKK